jgi:hypothetical protein
VLRSKFVSEANMMNRAFFGVVVWAFTQAVSSAGPVSAQPAPADDWREQYAYSVGVQAYIYAGPMLYLTRLRYKWATDATSFPYAALNHFYHFRNIADATYKEGGSPNNDTLYSWGFFDLSKEPVVLVHPDMGQRYFTFELADMYSNNFGYVGKRSTGSKAGAFLIAGPSWNGQKPDDVSEVIRSRTPYALVFGRTFVDGPSDIAAVNKLQDQYRVIPLSLWGKADITLPENRDVWAPLDSNADPLADWKTINRAMAENPPAAKDEQLLEMFATVGIGPGLTESLDKLDAASKRGLARAAAGGWAMVEGMLAAGVSNRIINGWLFPPPTLGRQGAVDDDFRGRAVCSIGGIICNDAAEAVYVVAFTDFDGQPLDGANRYTLRFEKGALPPANEFWSLTMYDPAHNLVDNPIDRYAIRDRTPGIKREADGSTILYCSRVRRAQTRNPIGCRRRSTAPLAWHCAPMGRARRSRTRLGSRRP